MLAILEAAQADLDLQVDVRRALVAVDDDARRWAAALMQDGAQGDARVAKVLGIPSSRVTAAADKLAARLDAVAPSDD